MDFLNRKFLIVDDEQIILDVFCEILELHGAKVDTAKNGNVAFEKIINNKFDLIISDVRMPECSGITLLQKLQKVDVKLPPIVMVSAFSDLSNARAKELGAIGLFPKPGAMENLKEIIWDILEDNSSN